MNKNTSVLLNDIRGIKRNKTLFNNPHDIMTTAK